MKRHKLRFASVFIFLVFSASLVAQDSEPAQTDQPNQQTQAQQAQTQTRVYEPYTADEFPEWALDLRRGEIILFGSFPFTFFFVSEGYDLYRYSVSGFDPDYAPWPFKDPVKGPYTFEEQIGVVVAAASLSLVIAVIDYAIRKSESKKDAEAITPRPLGSPDTKDRDTADGSAETATESGAGEKGDR